MKSTPKSSLLSSSTPSSSSSSLPTISSLSSSHARTYILLVLACGLVIYSIVFDINEDIDVESLVDYEEIEEELDSANPVRIVSYQSPIDPRLFIPWPPGVSYAQLEDTKLGAMVDKLKSLFQNTDSTDYCHSGRKRDPDRIARFNEIWKSADEIITNKKTLFDPDDPTYQKVMEALSTSCIVNVDTLDIGDQESGTGDKWVVTLEGGQKAMLKIIWEGKEDMKKDGFCNDRFEMPTSEIAAFHLHKILGFYNVPYTVGRRLDLLKDILPNASPSVSKQISVKSSLFGNESCVTGSCLHCKEAIKICPRDNIIETSLVYWIPRRLRQHTKPPLYMPFSTSRMEKWSKIGFNDKTYCKETRETIEPYEESNMYLDLFDFSVLDFLMYHFDSKHYTIDDGSAAQGLTIRLDHGRAFCAYDKDDKHIFLAPIYQCCTLRKSTYEKLMEMKGGKLSEEMRISLNSDPLNPILNNVWFPVIEKRFQTIIELLDHCFTANKAKNVLITEN